jgi:hypothetical protein
MLELVAIRLSWATRQKPQSATNLAKAAVFAVAPDSFFGRPMIRSNGTFGLA